jgi:hypothetical protein
MPTFLQSNSQGTPQGLGDLGLGGGYRGLNNVNTIGRGGVDFGGFPGAAQGPQLQMPSMMMGQPAGQNIMGQSPMVQNTMGQVPMGVAPGNPMAGQPVGPYASPSMGPLPGMMPQVLGGGAVPTGPVKSGGWTTQY